MNHVSLKSPAPVLRNSTCQEDVRCLNKFIFPEDSNIEALRAFFRTRIVFSHDLNHPFFEQYNLIMCYHATKDLCKSLAVLEVCLQLVHLRTECSDLLFSL